MLSTTFLHLPGVGPVGAKKLVQAGILTWDDALAACELPLPQPARALFYEGVRESQVRLASGDALWFSERLPAQEQWRLYPHFNHSAAYVDIETSGLSYPQGQITTIALYDGSTLRSYVQGRNLEDFGRDIEAYSLLVTWNGRAFDAPFIRRAMGLPLRMAHLDLFPVFRALGLRGGLKAVEKTLGLDRGGLAGVDGWTAVLLWQEYQRSGNPGALETLLAYNAEDVFSLELLSRHACAELGSPVGASCRQPDNPYIPDQQLLARLAAHRARNGYRRW